MKVPIPKATFLLLIPFFTFTSCEKEHETEDLLNNPYPDPAAEIALLSDQQAFFRGPSLEKVNSGIILNHHLRVTNRIGPEEPTVCTSTTLTDLLWEEFTTIAEDPIATSNFSFYRELNRVSSFMDTSEQFFGANGEYTNHVKKIQHDLERFWNMEGQVRVNGQHNETLNDRYKLADILSYIIQDVESPEDLLFEADQLLERNALSPNLPQSPLFSSAGFSTFNNLIIIGDGLVEMISGTGIDPKIAWTGILAHEWAHQIQIDNYGQEFEESPEDPFELAHIRELEADFMAAYYMTHKRGATYNWKRVEQFHELFFELGDCRIDAEDHHGTPWQRMEAARAGYELAESSRKKGHILTPLEVHQIFVRHLPSI